MNNIFLDIISAIGFLITLVFIIMILVNWKSWEEDVPAPNAAFIVILIVCIGCLNGAIS